MTTATSTSSSSLGQRQWHPSYLTASTPLSSVSFILPPCQYPVLLRLHTGLCILCAYSMSPPRRSPAVRPRPTAIPPSPASTQPLNRRVTRRTSTPPPPLPILLPRLPQCLLGPLKFTLTSVLCRAHLLYCFRLCI